MKLRLLVAACAAAFAAQLACSDGPTGPRPAALEFFTAPSTTAKTLMPLDVQPWVQLTDAAGNEVARQGVVVTATVSGGDGIVLSGSTATTDVGGLAAFENLTLGAVASDGGNVTLRFTGPGLSALDASIQLACNVMPMFLDTEISDQLAIGDCVRTTGSTAGSRYKAYDLEVGGVTKALRITDTTTSFQPVVLVRGPSETIRFLGAGSGNFGLSFKVLVPTGTHRILATSVAPATTGSFRVRITATPEDEPTCERVQIQSPVNTNQTLLSACTDESGNIGDYFPFVLSGAGSITASVTSSAFTPYVAVWRNSPNERMAFSPNTGSPAAVSFTNPTPDATVYYVFVGSVDGMGTGAYSLQATITNPTTGSLRQ